MDNSQRDMDFDDGRYHIDFGRGLPVVQELITQQREELIEKTAKETEQCIRQAVAETDWDEIAVLDVVERDLEKRAVTGSQKVMVSEGYSRSFKLYRYPNTIVAPDDRSYYTSGVGHGTRIYRITEQLCREIGVDPIDGTDLPNSS